MGKQISIYLNETEIRQLMAVAERDCRRTTDQARYLVLRGIGMIGHDRQWQPDTQAQRQHEMATAHQ